MIPIISIIGRKKAGKTTVLERLVAALKARGYRAATVKHHIHYGFSIDSPGKDTWRHAAAGADVVAISSPDRLVIMRRNQRELFLREIVDSFMNDMDIVLTEGYARAETPKILVATSEDDLRLFTSAVGGEVIVVVSDTDVKAGCQVFGFDEVKKLSGFIEERFLSNEQRHGAY